MESPSHSIQTFVANHGLEAVFLLMVLESACIPVPSEVTMIYAGYLVSQGDMSFVGAVLVGAFANLVGSWIAWGVGAYGVDAWLYRTERNRRHAEQAHRWFERYGTPVVFFSRLVPIVQQLVRDALSTQLGQVVQASQPALAQAPLAVPSDGQTPPGAIPGLS